MPVAAVQRNARLEPVLILLNPAMTEPSPEAAFALESLPPSEPRFVMPEAEVQRNAK